MSDPLRKDLNYYDLLEVLPSATLREINDAYKRAKSTYAQDNPALYTMFTREEATELMNMIEEAHEVLCNQQSRQFYDQQLRISNPEMFAGQSTGRPVAVNAPAHQNQHASQSPTRSLNLVPNKIESNNSDSSHSIRISSTGEKVIVQEKSIHFDDGFVSIVRTRSKTGSLPDGYGQTLAGPYKLDPIMEDEIRNIEVFDGHVINKIRTYKNVTLDQLSGATKVTRTYLEAVEKMDLTVLPAPVFVRGFVGHMARILGLDEKKVTDSYMKVLKNQKK